MTTTHKDGTPIIYPLSFHDVLNNLLFSDSPKWFQGENFGDGVFIKLLGDTITVFVFSPEWLGFHDCGALIVTKEVVSQSYREVCTQPDVERKI